MLIGPPCWAARDAGDLGLALELPADKVHYAAPAAARFVPASLS